jgi:hypothetical protein
MIPPNPIPAKPLNRPPFSPLSAKFRLDAAAPDPATWPHSEKLEKVFTYRSGTQPYYAG